MSGYWRRLRWPALARRRRQVLIALLNRMRALVSGFLGEQEEAQQRQELLRVEHDLAVETKKAEIEREAKVETAKIEAEARIRQERENEDVQTRKLQAEWEAEAATAPPGGWELHPHALRVLLGWLLHNGFDRPLRASAHPALVAIPAALPPRARRRLRHLLFAELGFPSVALVPAPLLALHAQAGHHAAGKEAPPPCGLVLDAGARRLELSAVWAGGLVDDLVVELTLPPPDLESLSDSELLALMKELRVHSALSGGEEFDESGIDLGVDLPPIVRPWALLGCAADSVELTMPPAPLPPTSTTHVFPGTQLV